MGSLTVTRFIANFLQRYNREYSKSINFDEDIDRKEYGMSLLTNDVVMISNSVDM